MKRLRRRPRLGAQALLLLGLCACGGDSTGPFEPQVSAEAFELQAAGVSGVTTTVRYTWENTGLFARVTHATTTGDGTATLTIRDAFGSLVYQRSLSADLAESTRIGSPGRWTITLALTGFSGTLNFKVRRL